MMKQKSIQTSIAIGVFALMATLISGVFRPGHFDFYNHEGAHALTVLLGVTVFIGWGPALAAGVNWTLFGKQSRTSSFFGTWTLGALVIALTPALVFGVYGYPNTFGMNAHLAGFIIGVLIYVYALGEEIGWRGYMHDALSPRPVWMRALIIAPVWFAWHLWFLQDGASAQSLATGFGIILVAAFFMSWLVSESRSWLSTAGFHSVANIAFLASVIDMPSKDRWIIAGTAFALMVIVHHIWKKKHPQKAPL